VQQHRPHVPERDSRRPQVAALRRVPGSAGRVPAACPRSGAPDPAASGSAAAGCGAGGSASCTCALPSRRSTVDCFTLSRRVIPESRTQSPSAPSCSQDASPVSRGRPGSRTRPAVPCCSAHWCSVATLLGVSPITVATAHTNAGDLSLSSRRLNVRRIGALSGGVGPPKSGGMSSGTRPSRAAVVRGSQSSGASDEMVTVIRPRPCWHLLGSSRSAVIGPGRVGDTSPARSGSRRAGSTRCRGVHLPAAHEPRRRAISG
jgi:hypothetical protein